jgi:hypothetical protein
VARFAVGHAHAIVAAVLLVATPIPRAVGSIVLFSALFAPLLVAPLLGQVGERAASDEPA